VGCISRPLQDLGGDLLPAMAMWTKNRQKAITVRPCPSKKTVQKGTSSSEALRAVITADVTNSRDVPSFQRERDRKLKAVSELHERGQRTISPYTVTAGGEFQSVAQTKRPFRRNL
jgi:hypothetical protein